MAVNMDVDVRDITPRSMPHSVEWVDNMKEWPNIMYGDIFNYLVLSQSIDGDEMRNFKSFESYNYFQSGSVGKVVHCRVNDYLLMKAEVRPSQKVSHDFHEAWIVCNTDGTVHNGGCTCMAGNSRTCSHVGAILWKIEYAVKSNMTGISCTDEISKWNLGTTRNIQPGIIKNMDFSKPQEANDFAENLPPTTSRSDFKMFTKHEELQAFVEKSEIREIFLIKNTTINKSVSVDLIGTAICTEHQHGNHSENLECMKCCAFYDKFIKMSTQNINILTSKTINQASDPNKLWHDSRKMRITGSSAHKVPVRDTTNPDKFLREHIYPSFHGNMFTEHGLAGEIKAKSQLKQNGFQITESGTIVSHNNPWLSVSPDGIIHTPEGNKLLEIKCPVLNPILYDSLETYFSSGKYDVVRGNNVNTLRSKGGRGYYLQIQLTLYVCELDQCKMVIWTPKEYKIINVDYDAEYCERELVRLKSFYYSKFLPRLVDDFEDGRLIFSTEYKSILN